MLKPNIRGYARSKMNPGLIGWVATSFSGDEVTIRYRAPWRVNWLLSSKADATLLPLQARSGLVHLVVARKKRENRTLASRIWKAEISPRLRPLLFVLFFGLALLVSSWLQVPIGAEKSVSATPSSKNQIQLESCDESSFVELSQLEQLLNSSQTSLRLISTGEDVFLGGIRSQTARLACGAKQAEVRLKFLLVNNSWKLSRAVRLGN